MSTLSIGYWSSVAAHQYFSRLQHKLSGLELANWYYVLVTIEDGEGHLSQQDLADRLLLDKVSMTRALDQLSEAGYVKRCDCAGDRRKHLVKLTPKAKPALRRIRRAYDELNEEALRGLGKAEREVFLGQLTRMVRNLGADAPTVRMTTKRLNA
ncbi:MAG: MarR family transcriptional regulator [Flavobacteriales bacterium]|nr:Transcriptional regulator SlyA [Flavobacteriales bacterium]MCC6577616.1 MarR family transcriptional regulator [Flavobacteriales bacterium]NUQ14280.1 MarR family transcriptional regulator [Flavobacteriales bacterium]